MIVIRHIEGGEDMVVDVKSLIYTQENVDQAINTKEQAEVLNGLFLGNHTYEEFTTIRQNKLAKLIDML